MKYLRILKPRARVTREVTFGVTKDGVKSIASAAQTEKATYGRTTSSGKGLYNGVPKPANMRKAKVTVASTASKADDTEKARTKLFGTIFGEPKKPTNRLRAHKDLDQ